MHNVHYHLGSLTEFCIELLYNQLHEIIYCNALRTSPVRENQSGCTEHICHISHPGFELSF